MTLISTLTGLIASLAAVAAGFLLGLPLQSVLLLLPAIGLCVALPDHWLPGEYANTKEDALRFLNTYNATSEEVLFLSVSASWNYNTDITDLNSMLQVGPLLEY